MRFLLLFIGLILFRTPGSAQFAGPFPIPARGDASLIAHYSGYMQMRTTERGMPLNVNAMAFDRNRTLWLALEDGLLRCEGDRHTLYQHARADSTSLPNNSVTDVREAPDGGIWVGTQSGMARLDPATGRFRRFRIGSDSLNPVLANRFWQVAPMPNGSAIALTEEGVFRALANGALEPIADHPFYARRSESHNRLLPDRQPDAVLVAAREGIFRISSSGAVEPVLLLKDLFDGAPQQIICLTWTSDSTLAWFDNRSRSFMERDPRGGTRRFDAGELLREGEALRGFRKGPHGEWWVWNWSGLLRVGSADHTRTVAVFSDRSTALGTPGSLAIRSAAMDDEGRFWLVGSHGALALVPADPRIERFMDDVWDQDHPTLCALESPDGGLLVGTYRAGAFLHREGSEWRQLIQRRPRRGAQHIHGENTVTAIKPSENGGYLFATYHGIHATDTSLSRWVHRDDLEALNPLLTRAHFMDLVQDRDGWWWAASWRKGLFRFNPSLNVCEQYVHDPSDPSSLPIDRLLCLLADREGNIWIGCNDGGGLCRYRRATNDFERIALDPGDALGEAFGVVRALAQDQDGAIWVGTHKGGLARYDPATRRTEVFDRERGVPGDLVRAIVADEQLGLWIGGTGGIAKWNPEQRVFQRLDFGVQWSDEINGMLLSRDGRSLLVLNGPEVVRVKMLDPATAKPLTEPRLTAAHVNGQSVASAKGLRLTEGRDRLAVEFALNDPIRAQGARVSWRLTGRDSAWTDCLGCRSATFGDLPSGEYGFTVRVLADDGAWSTPVTLLHFEVHPPWWSTWWFRLSALIALAMASAAGFRAYMQQRLRKERERFEREQAVLRERERIASDMHDDLGAGLSGLKLRSEMALRTEKDPAKREQLASLANSAGEIITSMRQMIWAMDQDQGSVQDLLVYATNYARGYCDQNGLRFRYEAHGQLPDAALTTQQRRNLFLVLKEALHNVVKHAHASSVGISAEWDGGLRITITDDGIGLPNAADQGTGNGMRNMRKRMTDLGGSIDMQSGQGTTIRLHAPIAPTPNLRSIVGRS